MMNGTILYLMVHDLLVYLVLGILISEFLDNLIKISNMINSTILVLGIVVSDFLDNLIN